MKKRRVLQTLLTTALALILCVGISLPLTSAAESRAVEHIYYSDLFFGYSTEYLRTTALPEYAQDTSGIMTRVFNEYVDSPSFAWTAISTAIGAGISLKDFTELMMDAYKDTNFLYENALDNANEKLIKELLSDTELANATSVYGKGSKMAKNSERLLKLYQQFNEDFDVFELTYEETLAKYTSVITSSGIFESLSIEQLQVYEEVLLPNLDAVKDAFDYGNKALEAAQALSYALLIEDARMEIIDDILAAATPGTSLYDGMSRLKTQLRDGWKSYFLDNYIKESVLEELYSLVQKELTGSLSAYGFVTALLKVASWITFDVLFDVPSLDDVFTQMVFMEYASGMYQILQQKILAFNFSVSAEDIFSFENLFSTYLAVNRLGLEASKSMALASNETDLNLVILTRSNFRYCDYIKVITDTIRLIAKDQRAVKTIQAWELSLPLTICEPSDEILPGCVYAFDGALQGNLILSGSGAVSSESGTAVINGDVTNNGGLSLSNSALEIHGNFTSGNGYLSFEHGQLEVLEDFTLLFGNSNSWMMKHADDSLLVHGDFSSDPWVSNLLAGRVEVKGNFNAGSHGYNANTYHHVTVFSGSETQVVSFVNPHDTSAFGTVYLNNPKVEFATEIYRLTLQQDYELQQEEALTVAGEMDMNGFDLGVKGDLNANQLNTNGGNLTVGGSMTGVIVHVSDGTVYTGRDLTVESELYFEHGQVEVSGDFTMANSGYSNTWTMTHADDSLLVHGDFSSKVWTSDLTAGSVEVKGDFDVKSNHGYYETGAHTTVFSGNDTQTVSFSEPTSRSTFGTVYLNNPKIEFATAIYQLTLQQDYELQQQEALTVVYELNLNGFDLGLNGDLDVEELFTYGGNLTVGGSMTSGYVNIFDSTVYIGGDLAVKNELHFEHGQVEVLGDFALASSGYRNDWTMTCWDDSLLVHGDLSSDVWVSNLAAGSVEVKGDFSVTSSGGYHAGIGQITVFSGSDTQLVSFDEPQDTSTFDVVCLNNPKVEFATAVYRLALGQDTSLEDDLAVLSELDLRGYDLRLTGDLNVNQLYTYGGDLTVGGSMTGSVVYVSYCTVYTGGDLTVENELYFEQGQAEVLGDFVISSSGNSNIWTMYHADDSLLVHGNFSSDVWASNLTAGRVEVKGDFDVLSEGAYDAWESHITVFSGSGIQKVSFSEDSDARNFGTVYLNNPKVEFASAVYRLVLQKDYALQQNEMLIVRSELDLNGHTLVVTGMLDAGNVSLNQGNLINVSCEGLLLSVHAELNTIEKVTFVLAGYAMDGKMCKTCLFPFTPESEEKTETFALQAWAECANIKVFAMDADSLPLCSLYKFK